MKRMHWAPLIMAVALGSFEAQGQEPTKFSIALSESIDGKVLRTFSSASQHERELEFLREEGRENTCFYSAAQSFRSRKDKWSALISAAINDSFVEAERSLRAEGGIVAKHWGSPEIAAVLDAHRKLFSQAGTVVLEFNYNITARPVDDDNHLPDAQKCTHRGVDAFVSGKLHFSHPASTTLPVSAHAELFNGGSTQQLTSLLCVLEGDPLLPQNRRFRDFRLPVNIHDKSLLDYLRIQQSKGEFLNTNKCEVTLASMAFLARHAGEVFGSRLRDALEAKAQQMEAVRLKALEEQGRTLRKNFNLDGFATPGSAAK